MIIDKAGRLDGLTVGELIEQLKVFPLDLPVATESYGPCDDLWQETIQSVDKQDIVVGGLSHPCIILSWCTIPK